MTAYICSGLTLPASALSHFADKETEVRLHNMVDMKFKVSAQVGLLGGSVPADETLRDGVLGAGTRDGVL